MFNVGSTEVILVFIVALLVIGPERLPAAIKTGALWIGRFRRSFYKVKAEIERELNTDEIKRQLHNESVLQDIEEAKNQVTSIATQTENSISNIVRSDSFDPGLGKELQEVKDAAESLQKEVEHDLNESEVLASAEGIDENITETEQATPAVDNETDVSKSA